MSDCAEELKRIAGDTINIQADILNKISEEIWKSPELGYEEHKAHAFLTNFLEEKGFIVEKHFISDTGFKATFGGPKGPHVAFICEYDSLPDIGHACGHNLIAEIGVGAGMAIQAALKAAPTNIGKVTIFGTPAEEVGPGKISLVNKGAFDDIDIALMAHPCSMNVLTLPGGVPACQGIAVTFQSCIYDIHGPSALDAAVLAYTNISSLRQYLKPSWKVAGIIANGGKSPDVIPEEAKMLFDIRASNAEDLETLKEKIVNCFKGAATATNCEMELTYGDIYKDMISNSSLEKLYLDNGIRLGFTLSDITDAQKGVAASTDMGNVSYVVPSIHPWYKIGNDRGVKNHTREFTTIAGDQCSQPPTILQAKMLAMVAIDVLCNPDLLKQIKSDFEKDLK